MTAARLARFEKVAWAFIAYTLLVVLWGAFVRATGSGAGCGAHWPLCNGEVVPRTGLAETLVEFTHRVTSGLVWIWSAFMVVYARRVTEPGHPVRRGAALTLFFMTTEALVGAGLVLFELVADNASIARAWWMGAHLINTFLLLAAMLLMVLRVRDSRPMRRGGQPGVAVFVALVAVMFVGVSGAITALGDTLYPVDSLAEGIAQDFSPVAPLFVRLRVYHPLLAIGAGLLVLYGAGQVAATRPQLRRLSLWVGGVFVVQVLLGFLNMFLLAPVWLQLVHLLVADVLWLSLLALGFRTWTSPVASSVTDRVASARRPDDMYRA